MLPREKHYLHLPLVLFPTDSPVYQTGKKTEHFVFGSSSLSGEQNCNVFSIKSILFSKRCLLEIKQNGSHFIAKTPNFKPP